MQDKLADKRNDLAAARNRLAEDAKSLDNVRELLRKADEHRRLEPGETRKWNRVLENLERSLDLMKARVERSKMVVFQLERDGKAEDVAAAAGEAPAGAVDPAAAEDTSVKWFETMHRLEALNLEEACTLQSQIDAGEIHDEQLEAGLALANQMQHDTGPEVDAEGDSEQPECRRQLVLRDAIDCIRKQQFDQMTLDQINLVMACHSLLTSRLEPTSRDQRLRRILDGAIKILRKRKEQMADR